MIETLLEVAYLSNVGIEINAFCMPVPSVVRQFAQSFKFDPLRMISSGTLVATVSAEKQEDASQALKDIAITFADVGRVIDGEGVRVIQNGSVVHYKDIHCEDDELTRVWATYTPDQ
ncbi:MAG: AIR synthase-related protein [Candidatus Euphemobacter frigidus]|nr:AIR synthase-related protein [Candidatus Euphemobacter frigidus]